MYTPGNRFQAVSFWGIVNLMTVRQRRQINFVRIIESTKVHYRVKLQQNRQTSRFQVTDNCFIRKMRKVSRSKVKVIFHRSLTTSGVYHSTFHTKLYVDFWSVVFNVCADRVTDRQTDRHGSTAGSRLSWLGALGWQPLLMGAGTLIVHTG